MLLGNHTKRSFQWSISQNSLWKPYDKNSYWKVKSLPQRITSYVVLLKTYGYLKHLNVFEIV